MDLQVSLQSFRQHQLDTTNATHAGTLPIPEDCRISLVNDSWPLIVVRHSERIDESHPEHWKHIVNSYSSKNNFAGRDRYSFSHDPPLSEPTGLLIADDAADTLAQAIGHLFASFLFASSHSSHLPPIQHLPSHSQQHSPDHITTIPSASTSDHHVHLASRVSPTTTVKICIFTSRTIRTVQTAIAIARRLHRDHLMEVPTVILSRGLSRILVCVQKRDKDSQEGFLFVSLQDLQRQYPDVLFVDGEQPSTTDAHVHPALPLPAADKHLKWRNTVRHIVAHSQSNTHLNILVGHRETIYHLFRDEERNLQGKTMTALPYCAIALYRPLKPNSETVSNTDVQPTIISSNGANEMNEDILTKNMVQRLTLHAAESLQPKQDLEDTSSRAKNLQLPPLPSQTSHTKPSTSNRVKPNSKTIEISSKSRNNSANNKRGIPSPRNLDSSPRNSVIVQQKKIAAPKPEKVSINRSQDGQETTPIALKENVMSFLLWSLHDRLGHKLL